MDRDFALTQKILLRNLSCPASVSVIDGRPIASGDIVEESEPIRVVLGNLACIISFNIIRSPEYPVILGLPWFELHNPEIDWRKRAIDECKRDPNILVETQPDPKPHEISTISLQQLQKDGQREDIFVFSVMATPSPSVQTSSTLLPSKYLDFGDVFDKGKATNLPEHPPI